MTLVKNFFRKQTGLNGKGFPVLIPIKISALDGNNKTATISYKLVTYVPEPNLTDNLMEKLRDSFPKAFGKEPSNAGTGKLQANSGVLEKRIRYLENEVKSLKLQVDLLMKLQLEKKRGKMK
jgi:hypothetical protein